MRGASGLGHAPHAQSLVVCIAALGINYQGSVMTLDLCDRDGKYSNGFCHWPQVRFAKAGARGGGCPKNGVFGLGSGFPGVVGCFRVCFEGKEGSGGQVGDRGSVLCELQGGRGMQGRVRRQARRGQRAE